MWPFAWNNFFDIFLQSSLRRRDSGSVDQNPAHEDHEPYEEEEEDDDDEDGRGGANKPTAASTPLLVNRKESLTYITTGKASPRSLNNESYSTIV